MDFMQPIHLAAARGDYHMVRLLLEFPYPQHLLQPYEARSKEGKLLTYNAPFDINETDSLQWTPLHFVCNSPQDHSDIIELLLHYKVKARGRNMRVNR